MNYRFIPQAGLVAVMAFLSSCAYMQTHKNIEEIGRQHTGYHLAAPLKLYRAGGQYYLAAEQQQLRIHYPIVHDSIFLNENNAPTYTSTGGKDTTVYFPISRGTGEVMQRQDDYVELETLKGELLDNAATCSATLPGAATECRIQAAVQGDSTTWITPEASTAPGIGTTILSTLDQVVIDWPGTVLYNAAIPFMAPFVFFHQFLTEE